MVILTGRITTDGFFKKLKNMKWASYTLIELNHFKVYIQRLLANFSGGWLHTAKNPTFVEVWFSRPFLCTDWCLYICHFKGDELEISSIIKINGSLLLTLLRPEFYPLSLISLFFYFVTLVCSCETFTNLCFISYVEL